MKMLLMRHGRTTANVRHAVDSGFPGAMLDATGLEQAQQVADAWGTAGIELIATSEMPRSIDTAAPLARHLRLIPKHYRGLNEVFAGSLGGRADREALTDFYTVLRSWMTGDLNVRMPNGEAGYEVIRRYNDALAEICISDPKVVLVVTHGALIRVWLANQVADARELVLSSELSNAHVAELNGDPEVGWALERWDLNSPE